MKKSTKSTLVLLAMIAVLVWLFNYADIALAANNVSGENVIIELENENANNIYSEGGDADQRQRQKQKMQQQQEANAVVNFNDDSIGNIPVAPGGPNLVPPIVPLKYERQINDLPSMAIADFLQCDGITFESVQTFENEIVKISGEKILRKLKANIKLRPTILNRKPATQKIFLVPSLPPGAKYTPIGLFAGDTKLDEEDQVYRQELPMFIAPHAMRNGANVMVVIPCGDSFRAKLLVESKGAGIGGFLSKILGGMTAAGIAPQIGFQSGSNIMYGESGIVVGLAYVEGIENIICAPPPPPPAPKPPEVVKPPAPRPCDPESIRGRIEGLEKEISLCKKWGINNLRLRFKKGTALEDLAVCTGEYGYFSDALRDFDLAEKNYLKGEDISANQAEADRILYKTYYNASFAVRQRDGIEAQKKFGESYNLEAVPNRYEELKH